MDGALSTRDVAAASGYSVQQVRDLEALGVIPPARRAPNGYRVFGNVHVHALSAYRALAVAVGPVIARDTMRDLPQQPLDEAVARLSSLHVGLARQRDDALAAVRALRLMEGETDVDDETMTITELAAALDLRTSTLRFWEHEGLIAPERVTSLRARRYPASAIREARITAALRSAGYRIPEVRETIATIRRLEHLDAPLSALQRHLDTIAERMLALLDAGAALTALLRTTDRD